MVTMSAELRSCPQALGQGVERGGGVSGVGSRGGGCGHGLRTGEGSDAPSGPGGSGADLRLGRRMACLTMKCTFSRLDKGRSGTEVSGSNASSPMFSWLATLKPKDGSQDIFAKEETHLQWRKPGLKERSKNLEPCQGQSWALPVLGF